MKNQSINKGKQKQNNGIYLGKTISGEEIIIEKYPETANSKLTLGKLRHSCKRYIRIEIINDD